MNLKKTIRTVPNFPKEGIMFRDITTLLKDPKALKNAINKMAKPYKNMGITKVVGAESRGFIFGTGIALKLGAGFVPVRKPGKLPAKTLKESYQLEYGTDTLEIHEDAIQKGEKVLIVDDLLATGGTIKAVCHMVEQLGGEVVGISFLIDLKFLHQDIGYKYTTVISYDKE